MKYEIIKEIVRGVDKSELEDLRVVSPILGDISVRDLLSGCKTSQRSVSRLICVL